MDESIRLHPVEEEGSVARSERMDAAANRARILATAERLFAERGVDQVNMADIAEEAEVGKGTLYRRFANKAELCLALMDTQLRAFQDQTLAQLRWQMLAGRPYLEQLREFLGELVLFVDRHIPLLCEVQRAGLLETNQANSRPHFWQYMTVRGLLNAAVQARELPPNLDTAYLADALLAPLMADIFRFQRERRGFPAERISAGLQSLVEGLRYASSASW